MLDWPVNLPVRNSRPDRTGPGRAGPGRPVTVTGYNYALNASSSARTPIILKWFRLRAYLVRFVELTYFTKENSECKF
jgi:hypothetical protein